MDLDRVLSLTFFVDARGPRDWRRAREEVRGAVAGVYREDPPPVTVVAEPPAEGRLVALEATLLSPTAGEATLRRRRDGDVGWTVVEDGPIRQVHAGGIASAPDESDPASGAEDAFRAMERVLGAEGLKCGQVVRQWNYIERLLGVRPAERDGSQIYQAFNEARARAYARSSFPAGYPASTGIGQSAGGVAIEFLALDAPPGVRVEALSNPVQIDAHRYSGDVLVGGASGRTATLSPPKFERAKRIVRDGAETILVSGTAAVVGERSVEPGDVRAQTRTAIEHMLALTGGTRLDHLRAYVKRPGDVTAVREVARDLLGAPPALCLLADVCRDELLVELEGLVLPAGPGPS